MSMRKVRFANVNDKRVEFAADNLLREGRHNVRESRSQKAQLESMPHGTTKGIKTPIKDRLT